MIRKLHIREVEGGWQIGVEHFRGDGSAKMFWYQGTYKSRRSAVQAGERRASLSLTD